MEQTFQIHTHKPKKQIPKKVDVSADGKIKTTKPRAKKEVVLDDEGNPIMPPVLSQKFEVVHGEKSCIVKMGTMSFGIKLGDLGIESVMRNCDTKDLDSIRNIISTMRTLRKSNVSFEHIANRLILATVSLPQTTKQLSNNLNKPPEAKPVAITVVE